MHDDGETVAQLVVRALEQAHGDEAAASLLFTQWMLADPTAADLVLRTMEHQEGRDAALAAVRREARRIIAEGLLRQGRTPSSSAQNEP